MGRWRCIEQAPEGSWVLLSPWSWGAPPSWHVDVFTNPEAVCTQYFWDFHTLYHIGMNDHYFSFQLLFPSWGMGVEWGWKFQVSNEGLVFWWPASILKLLRGVTSLLIRTKDTPNQPGNSKGFRGSVIGMGQRPTIKNRRCSECSYHLGNYHCFRSSEPGTRVRN